MRALNPNGELILLTAGNYSAGIATVGAGLHSLTFGGRQLVLPFPEDELPPAFAGKTLMPWPNRVRAGTYSFQGEEYQLPVNEAATGSALHGLVLWTEWKVAERSADAVTLTHSIHGEPGYPFQLDVTAQFSLDAADGLAVTFSAVNRGGSDAPYGVSSHPYITADGADVSGCEFALDAQTVLLVDDKLQPVERASVPGTEFDFSVPRKLGENSLDHAFTGLPAGTWRVKLVDPNTGFGSVVTASSNSAPWVQVYSGELRGRQGMAVEPMTCPPDAFNSGEDLIILAPGASHRFQYGIRAAGTAADAE